MKKIIILFLFVSTLFINCTEESDQFDLDILKIEKYIADNGINASYDEAGFYYEITKPGSGANPMPGAIVTVNYIGYLWDNTVFDRTKASPAQFDLDFTVPGWQVGVPLLKKGGAGIFLFPSTLGYGSNASGSIPPNSVLIFEIDLLDF